MAKGSIWSQVRSFSLRFVILKERGPGRATNSMGHGWQGLHPPHCPQSHLSNPHPHPGHPLLHLHLCGMQKVGLPSKEMEEDMESSQKLAEGFSYVFLSNISSKISKVPLCTLDLLRTSFRNDKYSKASHYDILAGDWQSIPLTRSRSHWRFCWIWVGTRSVDAACQSQFKVLPSCM